MISFSDGGQTSELLSVASGGAREHKRARSIATHCLHTSASKPQSKKPNTIIVRHWSIGQCLTLMCSVFMYMFAVHP